VKHIRIRIPLVLDIVAYKVPDEATAAEVRDTIVRGLEHYSDGRRDVALEALETMIGSSLVSDIERSIAHGMLDRKLVPNDGSAFTLAHDRVMACRTHSRLEAHVLHGENDDEDKLPSTYLLEEVDEG